MRPKNFWSSLRFFGTGQSWIPLHFLGDSSIFPLEMITPRYVARLTSNSHFDGLTHKLKLHSAVRTRLTRERWKSLWELLVWTSISSTYTFTCPVAISGSSAVLIIPWNWLGALHIPNCMTNGICNP